MIKYWLGGLNMQDLENKYIELLLGMCLNFKKSKSLFISYDKVNKDFVEKLIKRAREIGIVDIKTDEEDIYLTKEKLLTLSDDQIKNDPYFDKSIWNVYAEKGSNFLMLDTEFPHVMDSVSPEKLALSRQLIRNTREVFRKKETNYEIPWCIAALPNKIWSDDIFPDSENSYDELFKLICKMCLVDTKDPIKSWCLYKEQMANLAEKLNKLEIKSLHYKNSLGTDLKIEMPKNSVWNSIASEEEKEMFVNMPIYEIFSSPDYRKTEGIVYNSKPLVYGGKLIDEFYIKFKEGKVIDYDAKVGKEVLQSIIEGDSNSCYLGEVALVNYDSPISNTNLVFGTTLFDENASCHLALGEGFPSSIKGGNIFTDSQLLEKGINVSKVHVDFMIGTKDLTIEAECNIGVIKIFENGNFCI